VHKFGELESAVIAVIWDAGGEVTTVRQVYESLSRDRDIAYTTVLSTMDNLHRKGWLTKERRGKLLYFAPTMTRAEYSAQLMRDAMCAGGDSGLVLAHFVESISDQQSRHLHDLIQDLTADRDST